MFWIEVEYFYFQGTLIRPSDGYLADDNAHILEFDTPEEAEAHIDELESNSPYVLAHGEYAAPSYSIIDTNDMPKESDCLNAPELYKAGDLIKGGTVVSVSDLPPGVKDKLDAINVKPFHDDGAISIYRAETCVMETYDEEDEYISTYGINYYVRNPHLQVAALSGDLSNINWERPVYTVRQE